MSTTSNDSDSPTLYSAEMRWMMDDDATIEQCATEFEHDPTSMVLIRSMCFVTQTIKRLEEEIRVQHEEFNDLFNYATENPQFRRTLRPIVRAYRHRQSRPYGRTATSPSLQSDRTSPEPPLPPSNSSPTHESIQTHSSDSPRTVKIHSPASTNGNSPTSRDDSLSSYCTAIDELPGSQGNPIDVDASTLLLPTLTEETPPEAGPSNVLAYTPHPDTGVLVRGSDTGPLFAICPQCTRTGHAVDECIYPGPLICDYCRRPGHPRRNCPMLRSQTGRNF